MDDDTFTQVGCTALQTAACHDDVPMFVVKTLLEARALVDLANDNGDTALMMCVQNRGLRSMAKFKCLLEYGARIDPYNLCFQSVIHLAVACENIPALDMLLQTRKRILQGMPRLGGRKIERLKPDPLHLPDEDHETPILLLCRTKDMHYKTRGLILSLLLNAGADADVDRDREARTLTARKRGTGNVPPCWGLINCHLLGDFLIFFSVHKETYSMDVTVGLEMLVLCLDKDLSVLPSRDMPEFDIRMVFMRCMKQQFEFDASVDGVDMDIHFNIHDTTGFDTQVVGCNDGGEYKLAIRFPRGPCPVKFWTDELDSKPVFNWNIVMNKKYTLAHYAVVCPCPVFRRRLVHMAKPLCNPMRKCAKGLTAMETLQRVLVGTVVDWETKRLLASMRKDQAVMMSYIYDESCPGHCVEVVATKTRPKARAKTKSPFHRLSGDVCRHILSFL
ncbi:hypothetical protein T484DRAFT_1753825 [Baffinella frigidus]|nr:hypothetical protein T484DRAFT_1753825 [Cryptophyta sp. CCMP2293]